MRQFILILNIFASIFLIEGCKGTKAGESTGSQYQIPEDFQLILSRGGCRGQCPIYTLYVNADGEVKYQGEAFVELKGKYEKQISEEKVRSLVQAFRDAKYFEMKDRYDDQQVMDLPSVTLECTMNGQSHKVVDRFESPEELKNLHKQIDEIVGQDGFKEVAD